MNLQKMMTEKLVSLLYNDVFYVKMHT